MPEFSLAVCAAWGQGVSPQAWLSKHRVNPDASAVTSDDRLAEGQPKTRPRWTASVQAYKWQEHARVMFG